MGNPEYSKDKSTNLNIVKMVIQRFQPEDLNINNLIKYPNKLKEITDLQEKLDNLIYEVLYVLPEGLEESEI